MSNIAAVTIFAFNVENVTEPRLAFRQRTSLDLTLHRFDECEEPPENASIYYDYLTDGLAGLIGKDRDICALAEILGIPEQHLLPETRFYLFQHIGSVAAPKAA